MKYYLAFDKGQGTMSDHSDRYVRIDLSSYNKKGYFTSLQEANNFTGQFSSYSSLFMSLNLRSLIDTSLVGEPFTFCYLGKEQGKQVWNHCGTNRHIKENKVLFKDSLGLIEKPTDEALENAYYLIKSQKYTPVEEREVLMTNLTKEILKQELHIPNNFNYETATKEERLKFDFINALHKEIQFIVNDIRRSSRYVESNNFVKYINTLESFNSDLDKYLYDAKNYGIVYGNLFDKSIRFLIQAIVTKQDNNKQTLKIDNSKLFELATFYTSFFDKKNETMKYELSKMVFDAKKEKRNRKEIADGVQLSILDSDLFKDDIQVRRLKLEKELDN